MASEKKSHKRTQSRDELRMSQDIEHDIRKGLRNS